MASLIDTSIWIDFTRARSPQSLKRFIAPYILDTDAHLAEPIIFELLRHATDEEFDPLSRQFKTFPILSTPRELWNDAVKLGRACRKNNTSVGSIDLCIAAIAIHYDAELVSFDTDYLFIASVSELRLKRLQRPPV
ncbi:MAG: PIN domain-containing protein [Rectinemataceae bacterium]|jgi:hypothetical protein